MALFADFATVCLGEFNDRFRTQKTVTEIDGSWTDFSDPPL
ncbi:hypothetical protein BDE40_1605 [Litoreibacter halocynthiae]|uniref:Uncharacterized protein n=1 Tax=Litoreibacter halocynthiae TaxID=1242689 RepID=A0A4R7LJS2_9RHOB|nr:hypothetical protein BDE40_1605 [Litoreibacter halocynthiae]